VQRDGAVAGGRPRKPCSAMAQWPEEGRGSRAARWRRGRRKAEEAAQRDGAVAGGRPRKPKSWLLLSNQRAVQRDAGRPEEGRRKAEEAVQRDAPWPEEGRGSRRHFAASAAAAVCGTRGCGNVRHRRLRQCAAPGAAAVCSTGGCGSVRYRRLRQRAAPEAAAVCGTGGCGSVRHRRLRHCAAPEAAAVCGTGGCGSVLQLLQLRHQEAEDAKLSLGGGRPREPKSWLLVAIEQPEGKPGCY
jgi:hypothetical protein